MQDAEFLTLWELSTPLSGNILIGDNWWIILEVLFHVFIDVWEKGE